MSSRRANPSRQPGGFSLIEMLVGAAVLSLGALAVAEWMGKLNQSVSDQYKSQGFKTDFALMSGHLQRFLSTGSMRLLAFSGKNAGSSPADRALARVIVPLPGRCADLSACPGSTAVYYVSYDKTTTPAVTAVCALEDSFFVIDLNDTTYGTGTYDAAKSQFMVDGKGAFPSGPISTLPGQAFSLINVPLATTWLNSAPAAPFTVTQTGPAQYVYIGINGPRAFPSTCLQYLKTNASGNYDVSQLYRVNFVPFSVRQFSGNQAATSAADMEASYGNFPMRIMPVKGRTLGLAKDAAGNGYVAVRECTADPAASPPNPVIACGGSDFLAARPATAIRVEESYSASLAGVAASATRFEITDGSAPASGTCTGTTGCVALPVADSTNIPVALTSAESVSSLDGSAFSLLKEDALNVLRIRVQTPTSMREESFAVQFQ